MRLHLCPRPARYFPERTSCFHSFSMGLAVFILSFEPAQINRAFPASLGPPLLRSQSDGILVRVLLFYLRYRCLRDRD